MNSIPYKKKADVLLAFLVIAYLGIGFFTEIIHFYSLLNDLPNPLLINQTVSVLTFLLLLCCSASLLFLIQHYYKLAGLLKRAKVIRAAAWFFSAVICCGILGLLAAYCSMR